MSDAQVPAVERRSRAAPPLKGVERAKLLDQFAALHERHSGDPAAFRRAAVETLQAALDAGRDEARRALEAGGTGRACAETLSAETDELLRVGLEMSARWLAPAQSGQPLPTIVAVGGYGRGMLAPFSDIDLLFLLPDKPPPGVEKVVEALLYVLWDLKLKVGHATRTVDECLRQARADMTIRTTLVEARFIIGDKALFETLQNAVRQGDRRQDGGRIRRRQARGTRSPRQAGGRLALSRRAQCQGGQRGLARPQHAVLDLQIRLPRSQRRASSSPPGCSRRANSRCFAAARNSSGPCAAVSTFSPAGRRSD